MNQIFKGITPYDEDSTFKFAGRQEETLQLFKRIIRNDYTVYYAASGEGKSSLIRAGLLPLLRRRGFFPVYIVFKDEELDNACSIENIIYSRIADELQKHADVSFEQSAESCSYYGTDSEKLQVLEKHAWWKLRNFCFKRNNTELVPLYIFDQFEEVFTKASYDWTNGFFSWLEELSTDYVPDSLAMEIDELDDSIEIQTRKNFKALFSFRTEYLGDLDYWCVQKHFLPAMQENRICLKPLTVKGAKEVIALNQDVLGKYADNIILGCSEDRIKINNEQQPCVYALILSVVCQTLSNISDHERKNLLHELTEAKEQTIDKILLKFYRKKLKEGGLDYIRDEKIIEKFEDAFVDENGKRRRRSTDEGSLLNLNKWILSLSKNDNGLLKIVGKTDKGGTEIYTVEFPHDRLCKAIDNARKERQWRMAEKVRRQTEWLQSIFIFAIIGIVAFVWNGLLPDIKMLIFSPVNDVIKSFLSDYIQFNSSELFGHCLDAGFSAILLMIFILVFCPLLIFGISRKQKVWRIMNFTASLLGTICFGFLVIRNTSIEFSTGYVKAVTIMGFLFNIVMLLISCFRLWICREKSDGDEYSKLSLWPLLGGYLVFGIYVFYEALFCLIIGVPEPKDSSWGIALLPVLYLSWCWSFFNMRVYGDNKSKFWINNILGIGSLILLAVLAAVPPYNKQSYGMIVSVVLIVLYLYSSAYILWHTESKSRFYDLSKGKRILAIVGAWFVLIGAFIANIGYNPLCVRPSSVCHVSTWFYAIVQVTESEDSVKPNRYKLGVQYAVNGDTIIPCCMIPTDSEIRRLKNGMYPYDSRNISIAGKFDASSGLFRDSSLRNFIRYSGDSAAVGKITVNPCIDRYLQNIQNKTPDNLSNVQDSIDYYAAKVFSEIRSANIKYLLSAEPYGQSAIESLDILSNLQQKVLEDELIGLSFGANDTTLYYGTPVVRRNIDILEDEKIIGFFRELTRSILLCMLNDGINQSDIPSVFDLAELYPLIFFSTVGSETIYKFSNGLIFNFNDMTSTSTTEFVFSSDDIINGKVFAWYYLFQSLSHLDMGWNGNLIEQRFSSSYSNYSVLAESNLMQHRKIIDGLEEIIDQINESVFIGPDQILKLKKNYQSLMNESDADDSEIQSILKSFRSVEIELSFNKIKNIVLETLLPLINEQKAGVYNNAFENICQNLINMMIIRGYDTTDDRERFADYLKAKTNFYDTMNKIAETSQLLSDGMALTESYYNMVDSLYIQVIQAFNQLYNKADTLGVIPGPALGKLVEDLLNSEQEHSGN